MLKMFNFQGRPPVYINTDAICYIDVERHETLFDLVVYFTASTGGLNDNIRIRDFESLNAVNEYIRKHF